jgi:EpsI family protein
MSDRILTRRAVLASVLMAGVAVGGHAMVPTRRMSELRGPFRLESLLPTTFGDWHIDTNAAAGIVNPQTEAMLNRLYSQMLDRVYVDTAGHRIMLSIAYGDDQADDSVQLHYPEVCYPAQGFQLKGNRKEVIQLGQGSVKVRRLETQFGDTRFEPVTYWTIIGDQQSLGGWDRKIAEIRHGLRGEIVDGLLFRVSSIDRNTEEGFRLQDAFIRDVVAAMSASARRQLVGLD